MKKIIFLSIISFLATSCGSSGGSSSTNTTTTPNSLVDGYNALLLAANKMTQLAPSSSAVSAFSSDWDSTTLGFVDERTSTPTSPKEWMGIQLSPDAQRSGNGSYISMFGRLKNSLGILCVIGYEYEKAGNSLDANSYPNNGTYSLTIAAADLPTIQSKCDIDVSNAAGSAISITVSTPTSTSLYDKKVTMVMPGGAPTDTQTYYYKNTDAVTNVAFAEVKTDHVSRSLATLDKAAKVVKFEYISGPAQTGPIFSGDVHIVGHRLFYDEINDKGAMISGERDLLLPPGISGYTRYIMAGKPNSSGAKYSLYMHSTKFLADTVRQACVNAMTGIIDTDNASCGDSANSLEGFSSTFPVTGVIDDWNHETSGDIDEANTLEFDYSNFDLLPFFGTNPVS